MSKACVIGNPVSHSLSPKLHTYWLNQYAIEGSYTAYEIKSETLAKDIRRLNEEGFSGFNVTIPHKETIIPFLDHIDELGSTIGAVNTVVIKDDTFIGTNTDVYGFIENLKVHVEDVSPYLKTPVVLGTGGAARAIIKGLVDEGAKKIHVLTRDIKKAEPLKSISQNLIFHAWQTSDEIISTASLLINTTPLGMSGKDALNISLGKLSKKALVTDIVYSPLETPLLKQAKEQGNLTVDGLGMLIYQAIPGFELWFGVQLEVNLTQLKKLKNMLVSA